MIVIFYHSILDTWAIGSSASESLLVYDLDPIRLDAMFYIYFILNFAVQKSGFNIYLFDFLIKNCRKSENNFIIYKFDYKCKGFIIINTFLLFKSSDYLASFILKNFLLSAFFDFVYLFANQSFNISQKRN